MPESCRKEFFIQSKRPEGRRTMGLGSCSDIEMMFLKTRKPVTQIKKKARAAYNTDGCTDTSSVLYPNVMRPTWKSLPQVTEAIKSDIFKPLHGCPKTNAETLNSVNWTDPKLKKKIGVPKAARNVLPLNFWERDPAFFKEVFNNFNVTAVIDLYGSTNMAIACIDSDPPRPYLALLRNETHVKVIGDAIDTWIMKEMGREGPPASKFYLAEVKDLVATLFPPTKEETASDDGDTEPSDEDDD